MKKKFLQKIKELEARKAEMQERADKSEDIGTLRSLYDAIKDINKNIEDYKDYIADIEAEERSAIPVKVDEKPENIVEKNGEMRTIGTFGKAEKRDENPLESMEYRNAFKAYVQKGTPIPESFLQRNGTAINTGDTGAAIPITVMNEVINTVRKRYGNLYNKVRKMAVRGGVEIPVGALQASFKWINESTVSPRQDLGKLGKVTFSYHTAEIRISQTFLSEILTLSAFEGTIAEAIAIAYLEAMDYGIVNGSGNGSMLGILNDPRVTNTVTMTAAQFGDWSQWRKRFFSTLPLGYRAGEFIFPLSTVENYLETMADSNNNPIFRQATGLEVGDGDAEFPAGRFFGRDIALVEPNIIQDFDSASAGEVVGIFWQPREYAINENLGFTMIRYRDEELNEVVNKALVVVDGKVLNPTGYVKILKG